MKKIRVTKSEAERILRANGMQVGEYARYVDARGMVRFVPRKTGEFGVTYHGWREVSKGEAERIGRANQELKKGYLKPRAKKYF